MSLNQGDLELLKDPIAQELLHSTIPARLAYIALDGTPRVLPIWFHWNGRELVLATSAKAAKLRALAKNPKVAITIDDNTFPHKVLLVRGTATLTDIAGVVPEYALSAERYLGSDRGKAWIKQMEDSRASMVKITITPEWVGLLDFKTRLPKPLTE